MKRSNIIYIIYLLILLSCEKKKIKVQRYKVFNNEISQLINIEEKKLNKISTINDFLNLFELNFHIENKLIEDDPPGNAITYIAYAKNRNIKIKFYPDGFKYMKSFDINRKWNKTDFEKEDVKKIEIFYNNSLVETIIRD